MDNSIIDHHRATGGAGLEHLGNCFVCAEYVQTGTKIVMVLFLLKSSRPERFISVVDDVDSFFHISNSEDW